jgi:protein subunit release factor A
MKQQPIYSFSLFALVLCCSSISFAQQKVLAEKAAKQYEKLAYVDAIKTYESTLNEVRAQEDARLNQIKDELKKEYLKATQELQDEKLKVESELKLQLAPMSDALAQKILAGN